MNSRPFVRPLLIGIAGLSGAGKSELAGYLAAHLPEPCIVISIDSYYYAQDHLALEERARCNYDHPDSLEWGLLEAHLRALVAGEAVDLPVYLFDQHTRSRQTVRVEPAPYMVLEGLLALHREEIRELLDVKVFVETQEEVCFRRRLDRDMAERGRTKESVIEQYAKTVHPMALEYVLPSRRFADVAVSGEGPLEASFEAVCGALPARALIA